MKLHAGLVVIKSIFKVSIPYVDRRKYIFAVLAFVAVWLEGVQAVEVASASTSSLAPAADVLRIRHPHNKAADAVYAHRHAYLVALLELALVHSGQRYELEPVTIQTLTGTRNGRNLLSGYYDVNWLHTNISREQDLLPIRIPLFKGITGWRIFLIDGDDQARFSAVDDVTQLKALKAGLGHDWPDTSLMASYGFTIQTSVSRDSLMNMLAAQRVDYFPRSVTEAFEELDMYQYENIRVEKSLALMYPTAYYFFVAPNNQHLADVLTAGLESAIVNGDFDDLFERFYGDSITRAQLSSRRVFTLNNPLLSHDTPLERKELWIAPP
ncbi:hypothetical protein [Gilvimarinus polysaccharolyticus]|uniref:hypothetical protein n=1 Tax=Gilvimarinus polysaccharolyticus TaxID=863921 RepID=UPI00067343CE|nr:hypothetical protein [Gilvimarinus polysaccharolyticus]